MTLFEQLEQQVIGTLEHYQTDLYIHDKQTIEQFAGKEFLHFTRSTGTWLYILDMSAYPDTDDTIPYLLGRSNRRAILESLEDNVKNTCRDNKLIHHFKNGKLRRITEKEAINNVAEFTRNTLKYWNKQTEKTNDNN
jgi:hypothetical protein